MSASDEARRREALVRISQGDPPPVRTWRVRLLKLVALLAFAGLLVLWLGR